jgi:hypothetical protein
MNEARRQQHDAMDHLKVLGELNPSAGKHAAGPETAALTKKTSMPQAVKEILKQFLKALLGTSISLGAIFAVIYFRLPAWTLVLIVGTFAIIGTVRAVLVFLRLDPVKRKDQKETIVGTLYLAGIMLGIGLAVKYIGPFLSAGLADISQELSHWSKLDWLIVVLVVGGIVLIEMLLRIYSRLGALEQGLLTIQEDLRVLRDKRT